MIQSKFCTFRVHTFGCCWWRQAVTIHHRSVTQVDSLCSCFEAASPRSPRGSPTRQSRNGAMAVGNPGIWKAEMLGYDNYISYMYRTMILELSFVSTRNDRCTRSHKIITYVTITGFTISLEHNFQRNCRRSGWDDMKAVDDISRSSWDLSNYPDLLIFVTIP